MTDTRNYILFKTISLKELLEYRHKQFKGISLFISFTDFKGIEVTIEEWFYCTKNPRSKRTGTISFNNNGSAKLLRGDISCHPEWKLWSGSGVIFRSSGLRFKVYDLFILGLRCTALFTGDIYVIFENNAVGCYGLKIIFFKVCSLTAFKTTEHYKSTVTVCQCKHKITPFRIFFILILYYWFTAKSMKKL
mgnify:CR=1 FL=1